MVYNRCGPSYEYHKYATQKVRKSDLLIVMGSL